MNVTTYDILGYLSNFLDKFDNNYNFSSLTASYKINNFFKLSNKCKHSEFINMIPNVIKNCGKYNNEKIISSRNYIKRLVYREEEIYIGNRTGSVNLGEELKNKEKKSKLRKSSKNIVNKMVNTIEVKKFTIRNLVNLNITFDGMCEVKGKVIQVGLCIANKNTINMEKVEESFIKLKESINKNTNPNIDKFVTVNEVGELDPMNSMNSNIKIKLQTNSIKNGFWLYFLIILKEDKDIIISEPFSLITSKQLTRRKGESFLGKHKEYMLNDQESLFPYYFESMFNYNTEKNKYELRKTFSFEINFYQEKGIKCDFKYQPYLITTINNDKQKTEEFMEDIPNTIESMEETLLPYLNFENVEKKFLLSNTGENINNNFDITVNINNNEDGKILFSNMEDNINIFDITMNKNNNGNTIINYGLTSPTSDKFDFTYDINKQIMNTTNDVLDSYSAKEYLELSNSNLEYEFQLPYYLNNNLDITGEYYKYVNKLISLIYKEKYIENELNRLEDQRKKLILMNKNIIQDGIYNIYNLILDQQKVLLQNNEEVKKEKDHLESFIYNFNINNFLKKDDVFITNLNPKMNINQYFPMITEQSLKP